MRDEAEFEAQGRTSPRPLRVMLFTDTLGDVNGVSRFIQNVAQQANRTGRDLEVVTSTRFATPTWSNIRNVAPLLSAPMPGYPQLQLALPPALRMLRHARRRRPDLIHISTPGPVGIVGRIAARLLGVPALGVYHTDFPAYIDRLFDEAAFTRAAAAAMRLFYRPFRRVFARSDDYAAALMELGVARERIVRLAAGIDITRFRPRFRDHSIWTRLASSDENLRGIDEPSVKALYVGRVSVEKNLPTLAVVWKRVERQCADRGVRADLIIVGDGPYRGRMQEELAGARAHFLGFRHGEELSAIYASSDLFLFPSATDTLGQVVMESQASGLATVVSDQGGPKEVVRHGETGLVLPAHDGGAWARVVTDLVLDAGKRRAMGAAAARAMESYDMPRSFEHFWSVHEQAWAERKPERSAPARAEE